MIIGVFWKSSFPLQVWLLALHYTCPQWSQKNISRIDRAINWPCVRYVLIL